MLKFSYGIAENEDVADRDMKVDKQARTDKGLRVERGERPDGVVLKSEEKSDLAGPVDETAQGKKDAEVKAKQDQVKKEDAADQYQGEPDLLSGGELESDLFAPEKKHPGKKVTTAEHITDEADKAAASPENNKQKPTKEQIDAESYAKGHPVIQGLDIAIENPVESVRKPGWPKMAAHYGDIVGYIAADGDALDVFVNPDVDIPDNNPVFIINQYAKGAFDEHKIMMGFASEAEARKAYTDSFTKGWNGLNSIHELTISEFKKWLNAGDLKSEYGVPVKKAPGKKPVSREPKKAAQEKAGKGYGAKNKLVTKDDYAEIQRKLKAKLSNLSAGIDPELISLGTQAAVYHIEAGAISFADFTKAIVNDFGDAVKPYIRSWYEAARYYPGVDTDGMTSAEDIASGASAAIDADIEKQIETSKIDAKKEETKDGRTSTGGKGTKTLGGVATGKDEKTQETGDLFGGDNEGGDQGAAPDRKPDGKRVSGTRSGRSGSAGTDTAKTGRKPGRAKPGARTDGEPVPEGKGEGTTDDGRTSRIDQPTIPAANFVITEDVQLGKGSEAVKFNDNIDAIRTLKLVESENRRATPEEQKILARYVGWGGMPNAFSDSNGEFKKGWADRGEELKSLVDDKELAAARSSTRNAHYTSETIVRGIWDAVKHMGFHGGLALEPASGTGNFIGMMPGDVNSKFIAVEYDSITSRISKLLYPQSTVLHSPFQRVPLADGSFDLVIGNPPFGREKLFFQYKPEINGKSIHNQFFMAGLDALKNNGIMAMVVSRYLMDAKDSSSRMELAKRGELIGAIRLPDTAFKENARTEVVTDILFFKKLPFDDRVGVKLTEKEKKAGGVSEPRAIPSWVNVTEIPDPLGGDAITVNKYFSQNPEMIIGTLERSGSMRYENDVTVKLDKTLDFAGLLADAIGKLPANVMYQTKEIIDKSLARHKSMSESLEIALSGAEEGSITVETDGLTQVIEQETPEGGYELTKRVLTEKSIWSPTLYLDKNGKWYKLIEKLDDVGKKVKEGRRNVYVHHVFKSEDDIPGSRKLGKNNLPILKSLVQLRDLIKKQLDLEVRDAPAIAMRENRTALAAKYHAFVKANGLVNSIKNVKLMSGMPDHALILSLEAGYKKPQKEWTGKFRVNGTTKIYRESRAESAKPAAILSERVARPYEPPSKASSPHDALAISLSETGRVNLHRMADLLGTTTDDVVKQLHDDIDKPLIFNDPEAGEWVTEDTYLTGNVKRKLNAAIQDNLDKNIEALEKVQPEPIGAEHITPNLGMSWINPRIYAEFIEHLTGELAKVKYLKLTNSYSVSGNYTTTKSKDWSTDRATVIDLVDAILNSKQTRIYDKSADGKRYLNQEQTDLANLKRDQLNTEFTDWSFKDGTRREQLVADFNDKHNNRVTRQPDGSHLVLPGKAPDAVIKLRRHQKNAVWRGISERFMLLDHAVGAGKTFTAIARAMERRRMGLSRKPAIVVPNHMVEQFAADVYKLYPAANLLAADKKSFGKNNRRKLFAKIATGDWDIVIIPHSSFGFIPIAKETEERFLRADLDLAEAAVKEAEEQAEEDGATGWRKPFNVKQAEAMVTMITERLTALNTRAKDRLLTFEQMGIDDLTIDEAHEFKNLFYNSRLTGVRGMGNRAGSKKALDLYNKTRILQESPTGTITFMTGTPISNSAVEMYNMMRYLAPDMLEDDGLSHFDAWTSQYVGISTKYEPTESGSLKEVNRMGRYWSNMRSLMDGYYSFTDAVSNEDIKKSHLEDEGVEYPLPKIRGGKRQSVVIKPTKPQEAALKIIIDGFDSLDGIEDPKERNIERLKLMDRARKVSLDVRAVNKLSQSKEEGGKLEVVADKVFESYQEWNDDKGTQLIFLDRSVPTSQGDDTIIKAFDALVKKRDKALADNDEAAYQSTIDKLDKYDPREVEELRIAKMGGWNAYDQIKENLIAKGIPADEIRFIQEAKTDEQKQEIFDAVVTGEIRVLIGSTPLISPINTMRSIINGSPVAMAAISDILIESLSSNSILNEPS